MFSRVWFPFLVSLALISCSGHEQGGIEIVTNQEILDAVTNAGGKVTVVNFWATWCPPCVKEMPDLIRFYHEYEPKGIRFISVSVDDPEDPEKALLPFMEQRDVPFEVFVPERGQSPAELTRAINPKWNAGLPATFVYDRQGRLYKSWFRDIEYAELVEVIAPLLNQAETG